jgi:hypothetical protein
MKQENKLQKIRNRRNPKEIATEMNNSTKSLRNIGKGSVIAEAYLFMFHLSNFQVSFQFPLLFRFFDGVDEKKSIRKEGS